jgi:hypothetical protein
VRILDDHVACFLKSIQLKKQLQMKLFLESFLYDCPIEVLGAAALALSQAPRAWKKLTAWFHFSTADTLMTDSQDELQKCKLLFEHLHCAALDEVQHALNKLGLKHIAEILKKAESVVNFQFVSKGVFL